MLHLLQVDVAEDELLVAAVDDRGAADEDFSERKRNIFITETEKLKSLGIERDKEALAIILS